MNDALFKQMRNISYVKIDAPAAHQDWLTHVEGVERMYAEPDHMASHFYRGNFTTLQRKKATAGILGHRSRISLRWRLYCIKEQRIRAKC